MKVCYIDKNFRDDSLAIIATANQIIREYQEAGFSLTLRQLYYQFVARDILPNSDKSYNRLGSIINDARLAGMISWTAIEDRTRFIRQNSHWNSPADIIEACARQFRYDRWEDQSELVEVWIEKDALVGVIEPICRKLDVPYFSCRGYTSASEMWVAAQRMIDSGKRTTIIHLGDHDPSGIDMTRDIRDRLDLFGAITDIHRIALNMDQVEEYGPPPNPAKLSDSRASGYIARYGRSSWELDALDPVTLAALIENAVMEFVDQDAWEESKQREQEARDQLMGVSDRWDEIAGEVV